MLIHETVLSKTPNIIIIMTDQQRADAVGYINKNIITPNLNKLASMSVICTEAFVQSPQCQPSRASIMTGRYPTAHQVWWNDTKLSPLEKTIGNYFKNAGYSTGYFGKFHIDGDGTHTEIARHFGFDDTFLSEDWRSIATTKLLQNYKPTNKISKEFFAPMSTKTWVGQLSDRELHHEDVITNKAVEFIQSQRKPYLAIVSYNGPHPPYASPPEFNSLYDRSSIPVPDESVPNLNGYTLSPSEWQELKCQYYGSISWIDDNIGKILNADSTAVVVFLSDHGDILGDHGLFSKGIFTYDGNIKIPLLFRIPGIQPYRYTHLIQAIDILPTILSIANIPESRGIQGKSLLSHLKSNTPINDYVMSMLCHNDRLRMIRTKTWKYWVHGRAEYFYDLQNDPNEDHNIAHKSATLSAARYELLQALIKAEDPLPFPNVR